MEYSAILHDMDKRFCYAIDKDLFVIRVQVIWFPGWGVISVIYWLLKKRLRCNYWK